MGAHLLCGSPVAATQATNDLLERRLELNPELAEKDMQAWLLRYHSSLAPKHFQQLDASFSRGGPLLLKGSNRQQQTFRRMVTVREQLRNSTSPLRLQDVLVEWTAQR